MRFMMAIKSDAQAEAGVLPDRKIMEEMGKYMESMTKAGILLSSEALHASSRGARVRMSGHKGQPGSGKITVIDGPFAEAKEVIAGFWLVQVASRAEAITWAQRFPGGESQVELRPLYEVADFPADPAEKPQGWRDQEERFREAAAAAQGPARRPGTRRYMLFLKSNRVTESGVLPNQKALAAMGALAEDMVKAGVLLSGDGLKPSAQGARVTFAGGKSRVVDGPFAESKEMIAGYFMIQVASKEEAVEWAKRFLRVHVEGVDAGGEGEIEVREVFELADLPGDLADAVARSGPESRG